MEWITSESHTFVIRLWLEESSWESNSPSWRGHITHYPSGNRRYVSDLDEIAAFILPFLEEMGVAGKSANRAPPAEASRKPHQIAPGTDWQSVGKATGSDDSEGEREMIQWTWSFNGTNASDSTKTTMEGTLWVDGLDKFDVEVPGWQTRQVEILPSSLSCIEFIGVQWAKEKPAAGAASPATTQTTAPAQRVLFAIVPSDAQGDWKPGKWFLLDNPQLVMGRALIEELEHKPLRLMIANEGAPQAKISFVVARQVQSDCDCPIPGPTNVAPFNPNPCPPEKEDCPPAKPGNGNPCPPPATNDCQPTQQQPSDCAPEKQPDDDCGAQDQKNPSTGGTGSAN